jgi:HlyD family secretion protein
MQAEKQPDKLPKIIIGSRPAHPLWKGLLPALTLVLSGWLYWKFIHNESGNAGPVYKTEMIERGDIDVTITATGNLAPTNQVTIGSELSGTIAEVLVDINDTVKKGQPLAELDTSKLIQQTERNRALLLSAKSRVTLAEANLNESSASFSRLDELLRISQGKTPSKSQMDAAKASVERSKAELESAKAAVSEAEAGLRSIERDLSKSVIRSPVDGIVLTRSIDVGQTVAASFTAPVLFLIAEDLKKMDLVVSVAESDIGRVAKGQPAIFRVDAWPTRTYNASIQRVAFGSLITNNVVTYNVDLGVDNEDLSLRPGMTATADIALAQSKQVLLVPNAALRFDPESVEDFLNETGQKQKRTLVQMLSPSVGRRWGQGAPVPKRPERDDQPCIWLLLDDKPVKCPVVIGLSNGRFTEVTGEGLREGIPVIVSALPETQS